MIQIDNTRCTGCGLCIKDCITGNIRAENGKAVVSGPCFLCGHCVAICPQNAVSAPEYADDPVIPYDPATFSVPTENLLHMIRFRRSVRNFQPQPVEKEKLLLLAYAGRHTATAKNTQGCRFVFVQEELQAFKTVFWSAAERALETAEDLPYRKTLQRFCSQKDLPPQEEYLFRNAPAVLFISACSPLDAGLAAQNMELTAVTLGLGTMYNGYLCRMVNALPEVLRWLRLENAGVDACMLLGIPAVQYHRTAPRRTGDVDLR